MADLFKIRGEVSPRVRVALAILSWSLLVLIWFVITNSDLLPPFSLPRPKGVALAFVRLWTEYDLLQNVFQSWWRIAQAFLWCVAIAIPLGLLMASFGWLHDFINPVAAAMRSMPITAFLPAFIALFGMDETEKVSFLYFGMFFYLLAVVVEEVRRVDQSLLSVDGCANEPPVRRESGQVGVRLAACGLAAVGLVETSRTIKGSRKIASSEPTLTRVMKSCR